MHGAHDSCALTAGERDDMIEQNWSGIHIPIITPFTDDNRVDEDGLRRLVDYLIDVGIRLTRDSWKTVSMT
jgi:hypothetical protein